jgi:hypothetical protein
MWTGTSKGSGYNLKCISLKTILLTHCFSYRLALYIKGLDEIGYVLHQSAF